MKKKKKNLTKIRTENKHWIKKNKLPINVQTVILSEHLVCYDIIIYNYFYMKSLEPWAVFRSTIDGQRLFMYKSSKHLISSHLKKYIWLTLLNIIKLEINERSFFDCQNISQKRTKYKHKIYKVKQSSLQ